MLSQLEDKLPHVIAQISRAKEEQAKRTHQANFRQRLLNQQLLLSRDPLFLTTVDQNPVREQGANENHKPIKNDQAILRGRNIHNSELGQHQATMQVQSVNKQQQSLSPPNHQSQMNLTPQEHNFISHQQNIISLETDRKKQWPSKEMLLKLQQDLKQFQTHSHEEQQENLNKLLEQDSMINLNDENQSSEDVRRLRSRLNIRNCDDGESIFC